MSGYFPAVEQAPDQVAVLAADGDTRIERTVLPNGLRIITESVPGVLSATVGVWAGVGSRDETPAEAGAAHFLEHLLFKGTPTRSALDIAASMDAVGGEFNAFTSKEYTCFYAKTLKDDLPLALDVLLDVTQHALLRESDIDSERMVVLEEIAMHDDDPNDRAHEALLGSVLKESPLALPILGTKESIATMSADVIRYFFSRHYQKPNLVVAVAGDVEHAQVVAEVSSLTDAADPAAPRMLPARSNRKSGKDSAVLISSWPGEQAAVGLGSLGVNYGSDQRRPLDVLNTILGGGMSSRLFQRIREQRGLAYSVYSYHSPFSDAGLWGVSAGCSPANVENLIAEAQAEIRDLVDVGVTADELDRAKGHLAGSMVLGGEETAARMSALGRAEVATGQLFTLSEALDRVRSVNADQVVAAAHAVLAQPKHLAVVGPEEFLSDWQRDLH